MESKIRHLEMIQNIIGRMANNSFWLKGWSVILVSALFALSAKDTNVAFIYIAYLPAIAFWILDGYFLRRERVYRKLYDKTREQDASKTNFSMNTEQIINEVATWRKTIFSKTLFIFHGSIVVTILIVTILVHL